MYQASPGVTTTDSSHHNMAGSTLGPVLHGASVLMFIAGITALLVSRGHLRSKPDPAGDPPRRREGRSLDRLHPEDVEVLYRQGIFSAIINSTLENSANEALLILLPALEKFENVMVEESRKIRTALKDHDSRLQYLEDFISRQRDVAVQNTQEIQHNKIDQEKARIKVTRSKAQNEVLKTGRKKKKEIVLKETIKRPPVDVEIVRNETILTVPQNDSVVVEDVKEKTLLKNVTNTNTETIIYKDVVLNNDTVVNSGVVLNNDSSLNSDVVLNNDSSLNSDVVLNNDTILNSGVLTNNDTVLHSDTVSNNETSVNNDTLPQRDTPLKDEEIWRNETASSNFTVSAISVNDTEPYVFGNSSEIGNRNSSEILNRNSSDISNRNSSEISNRNSSEISNSTGEANSTTSAGDLVYNVSVTLYPDNTAMDTLTSTPLPLVTTSQPMTPHTVAMTTTSTSPPTVSTAKKLETLEETVSQLREKVASLERVKVHSGIGKLNSYKRKIRSLEKNFAEMKRRYRKIKTRVNSYNARISGLAILQSVAYSGMPRNLRKEYEAKKATILRFDRIERRLTNYRDMVIRNRHEIRDLKGLTSKQEHYIGELQAGSDRFEHKSRELTANIHGMETTIGNLFNSLNGYMSDVRWELRVMLDRVCGDNQLHCS